MPPFRIYPCRYDCAVMQQLCATRGSWLCDTLSGHLVHADVLVLGDHFALAMFLHVRLFFVCLFISCHLDLILTFGFCLYQGVVDAVQMHERASANHKPAWLSKQVSVASSVLCSQALASCKSVAAV